MNLESSSARGVSTDSRSVSGGQIFFALRGENFDGHKFVSDAIAKGASCAVVERKWLDQNRDYAQTLPLVVVENTVTALGQLARIHRRKFDVPVVAVGGSNGKTTTKEMVARVLGKKMKVLKTAGNHNNQIGVPLTLFQLSRSHEAAVVEIGTNQPGEIARLCEILLPTGGLITNIGREHLEFFRNIAGVGKEEGALFEFLGANNGTAFVNKDDDFVVALSSSVKRRFTYGFTANRSLRRDMAGRLFGFDAAGRGLFEMKYKRKTELVRLGVPGIHNAFNAAAAAAVGFYFGVSAREIKKALESYRSIEKRMELLKIGGVTILNDTYNSNPDSVTAAVRWLSMVTSSGRRIVALGDMLELGKAAAREHREVGKKIAKQKFDYLLTYGNLAREIAVAADSRLKAESFEDKSKLIERLMGLVAPGDVVLVKGSRGMKMEEVVNTLAEKLKAGARH